MKKRQLKKLVKKLEERVEALERQGQEVNEHIYAYDGVSLCLGEMQRRTTINRIGGLRLT